MTQPSSNPPPPRSDPEFPAEANPAPPGTSSPSAARPGVPAWWLAVLLAVATIALYWPATRCEFVNYDDPDYVTENPRVLAGLTLNHAGWAFTTGRAANWHPVTWLSLMLDVNLFGKRAAGFHFTNLALHAVNAVLLFWLLWRLTGAQWRSAGVAALFAWHPVHVESVAWVAERKDGLCAGFGFLALLFYVRFARSGERGAGNWELGTPRSTLHAPRFTPSIFYWLAWFCFALGLMSKPMLVTWPFVLLLLDYWPLERFKPGRTWPLIREKIPFLAVTAVAGVVTFVVQKHGGAMVTAEHIPFGARAANALISYVRYMEKLFWPADLAVIYPHPGHWPPGKVLLAVVLMAGISTLCWRQRRRYPFLLMGWLWYVGTLVPVIGLVQVGDQAMADRYLYIPSVGMLICLVWGGYELTRRRRGRVMALTMAGSASMALCLALTRHQLRYWRNSETLFRHALAVTENNYTAHNNLGTALDNQGETDKAILQFQEVLRLKPDNAVARFNLGNALAKQGRTDAAISEFQTSLSLQPDYAQAHNNLGNLLANQGQTDAAISQFQAALHLNPDFADAHYNLGNALLKLGRWGEATRQFQAAIELLPEFAPAHYNLGVALNKQGRTDAAISQFQAALRLKPDYAIAHNSLGIAFGGQGRLEEAIREFQEALRFKPDYASAQSNLAKAMEVKSQTNTQNSDPVKP